MTDKLDSLSYSWSRIDGQGLVRVIPIDSYKTGFVLITHIGALADACEYYPDLTLGREKVTVTIDDDDETKAYALARDIDKMLTPHDTDAI